MIFVTLEREIFYYYFYHKFWSVIIPDSISNFKSEHEAYQSVSVVCFNFEFTVI